MSIRGAFCPIVGDRLILLCGILYYTTMATTPKAIRYASAVRDGNYGTLVTFTGDDATVDAQWTQLVTTTPGILSTGVPVIYAQLFNPAILNSNNQCIFGVATNTFGTVPTTGFPSLAATSAVALVNGANNNLTGIVNSNLVFINGPSATFSITGVSGGTDGAIVTLYNTTAYAMTISNNSGSSSAGNKIVTGTGADVVLSGTGSVTVQYQASLSQWVLTSFSETPTSSVSGVLSGSTSTFPTNSTKYVPMSGFFATPGAAITLGTSTLVPTGGTISKLILTVDQVPGGADTVVVTVMKNGVATTLTATLTSALTTISDTTHSFTVASGDTLSLRIVASATSACAIGAYTVAYGA